ncbi:MAG: hypothetical protein R3C56_22385 [Pirellulaceae bacterium]
MTPSSSNRSLVAISEQALELVMPTHVTLLTLRVTMLIGLCATLRWSPDRNRTHDVHQQLHNPDSKPMPTIRKAVVLLSGDSTRPPCWPWPNKPITQSTR